MVAVVCVMTRLSVNDHCLHNCLSVVFHFCCLTLASIYTTCFHPSPFPDDDTRMSVETSDISQSWLELPKIIILAMLSLALGRHQEDARLRLT